MRSSFALLALFGSIAAHIVLANAARSQEPVNPFTQSPSASRGVSASVSDEFDEIDEQRSGFSWPKLALPKLPKPRLPKFELPTMKMPKISMPQWTRKEPTSNPGPSTWEKLSSSTKAGLAKTRRTLMPWTVEAPPSVRSATGSRSSTGFSRTRVASNRGSRESSTEKKSIFSSLLPASEPEEKPIETTGDFLSQPRPRFD